MAGQVSVCVCVRVVKQSTHQGGLKRSERVEYGTFKNLKPKPTKIEKCFLQLKPDKQAFGKYIHIFYVTLQNLLNWNEFVQGAVEHDNWGWGNYKLQHNSQPSTHKKEFFLYFFKSIFFCLLLRTNDLNRKCRYDRSQKKHNIQISSARRKH